MGHASAIRVRYFTSPNVVSIWLLVSARRFETDMVSWMTRKWEYGDPEDPVIGGQLSECAPKPVVTISCVFPL